MENYDALITALLVDAFNALADALEQARLDALSQPPRAACWPLPWPTVLGRSITHSISS